MALTEGAGYRPLRPAVFLDKDGTVVEDRPYNVDPEQLRLLPGAAEGLRRLQEAGYLLIMVSNQAGVARGYFDEAALERLVARLSRLLAEGAVRLDGFYYCPHHPEATVARYAVRCRCRKPAPGLLLQAAREHAVDRRRSWMIGDILDDVEAGRRAGCRTVLVDNGHETVWHLTPRRQPDATVRDLREAAGLILAARAGEPIAVTGSG